MSWNFLFTQNETELKNVVEAWIVTMMSLKPFLVENCVIGWKFCIFLKYTITMIKSYHVYFTFGFFLVTTRSADGFQKWNYLASMIGIDHDHLSDNQWSAWIAFVFGDRCVQFQKFQLDSLI